MYHIKNVLNGGEISPMCRARAEQDRYKSGCDTLLNFLPMPQGGVTRRPGFQFIYEALSKDVRLIPFVFSQTQGRVLEFGEYKMRIWMPDGTAVASDGGPLVVATPYPASALPGLRFAQSADVIYFAHHDYAPRKLSRYGDADWRWSTVSFSPSIAAPTGLAAAILGKGSTSTDVSKRTYTYVVTAVDEDTGQESQTSASVSIEGESMTSSYGVRLSWTAPAGTVSEYRVYKLKGGIFGFIGRAKGRTSFEDYNIVADAEDTPPTYNQPFSGDGNFPSLVFFYQGRLGWAATKNKPMTVWLSKSGDLESLAESVVPKADDSIEVTMATTQANGFSWLKPDRTALCIGTTGNEWTLAPSSGAVLTPSNPSYSLQTSFGGDSIDPLLINGAVVYVQRGSNSVRAFAYTYNEDKYLGQDLTILSRHILRDVDVSSWCYQQEPYSIIWSVLSDGTLASCTLMIDQQVCGWARHETGGRFLDVCTIPGTPDDQVWAVVQREINGESKAFLERLADYFDSEDLTDAFFLDCAMQYTGTPTDKLTGLTHLAGESVTAFADGSTLEGLKVAGDGSLALPRKCSSVVVGLAYTSEMKPTRPEIDTQQGSSLMHNRRVSSVRTRVYRSMSFEMGIDGGSSWLARDRNVTDGTFSIDPFFVSGVADLEMAMASGWSPDSIPYLKVSTPTPLTILAVTTSMDISAYTGRAGG